MKTTITLHLPEQFKKSCETAGIQSDQAIQRFVNHVYVYAHLAISSTEPESIATNVFNSFLISLGAVRTVTDPMKREMGIHYTREILHLIGSDKSPIEKEEVYQDLIDEWYTELCKMNEA